MHIGNIGNTTTSTTTATPAAVLAQRRYKKLAVMLSFHGRTQTEKAQRALLEYWTIHPPCNAKSTGGYELVINVESAAAVDNATKVANLVQVRPLFF